MSSSAIEAEDHTSEANAFNLGEAQYQVQPESLDQTNIFPSTASKRQNSTKQRPLKNKAQRSKSYYLTWYTAPFRASRPLRSPRRVGIEIHFLFLTKLSERHVKVR